MNGPWSRRYHMGIGDVQGQTKNNTIGCSLALWGNWLIAIWPPVIGLRNRRDGACDTGLDTGSEKNNLQRIVSYLYGRKMTVEANDSDRRMGLQGVN